MQKHRQFAAWSVLACALQGGLAVAAQAQQAVLNDEIVVTAEKRESRLQETPIAITVIGGDAITRGQIQSSMDLSARVPGMIVGESSGQAIVSVRGVSHQFNTAGAEPGVTVNVDGVVVSQPSSSALMLFDVANIEVLRGPQGTLYGRNTTGGALNIHTRQPTSTFEGEASALAGSEGRWGAAAVLSGPLGDGVSARLAALYDTHDGYFRNIVNGERHGQDETLGLRGQIRIEPTDTLTVNLRADTQASLRDGSTYRLIVDRGAFAPLTGDPWTLALNFPGYQDKRAHSASGTVEWDAAWGTIRSISAYSENELNFLVDIDGTAFDYLRYQSDNSANTFTQEFNVLGGNDRVNWLIGAFYLDEDLTTRIDTRLPVLAPSMILLYDFAQSSTSAAAFGQINIDITDRLRASAGLRYTHDEKSVTQATPAPNAACPTPGQPRSFSASWNDTSPMIGLDYRFTSDIFAYARASRGYKAGGYNPTQCGNVFDPEEVTAYEVGLKTQLFNRALTLNLTAFQYDYENFQANVFVNLSNFIINATSVNTSGAEAEISWNTPIEGLRLSLAAGYLDAEFGSFATINTFTGLLEQVGGNRVPRSPEFTGNIVLDYERTFPSLGTLSVMANHAFSSKYYFELLNDPGAMQQAYGTSNLEIGLNSLGGPLEGWGDWTISVFGRNLEDEAVLSTAAPTVSVNGVLGDYNPPRTYGVRLRAAF